MESLPEFQASRIVWQYCPPVLFAFGLFGNTLTVLIVRRMRLKDSAMPVYLTALALSDTCQIFTGLLRRWLIHVFGVDVRAIHSVTRKPLIWLVYCSINVSAWLLSCMTLERTVSVWRPHRVSLLCSRSNALVVVVSVVVVSALVNGHMFVWVDVVASQNGTGKSCYTSNPEYLRFFNHEWSWLNLALSSFFPFACVLLGNLLIVWKVSLSVRMATKLVSGQTQDVSHRQRKTSSMTVMLMVVSAVFFLTMSPIFVYNVIEPYVKDVSHSDIRARARLSLAWAVVNMLMYTNSTVNFYLYCLSGTKFRQELKQYLCCQVSAALSFTRSSAVVMPTRPSQPAVDSPAAYDF